ncbi:hypothetical protein F4776DRAFT_615056 [Hypoxylon sp. NC0597]|nr:hypothetical protein F4776DRAFT_615056 [Hypoxylon sp. NC0597]
MQMADDITLLLRGLTTASSNSVSSPPILPSEMEGVCRTNHHISSPSHYHLPNNTQPLKRKSDSPEDHTEQRKKQKRVVRLSPDLVSRVLSYAMDSDPICVFDLLVPEWHVCKRRFPQIEMMMELTRVVTYTRDSDGKASSLTVNCYHGGRDHVFLPMKIPDHRILTLNRLYHNEALWAFCHEGTQVFRFAMDALPANIAEESFLELKGDVFPIRGKRTLDILPFDDELNPRPKRKIPGTETHLFKLFRHIIVHSPLWLMQIDARSIAGPATPISDENLEALDVDIDFDCASSLWLSWRQMPMLESVLLDLRVYSHDKNTCRGIVGKVEVMQQAQVMSRYLNLNLLVIAGLQSYSFRTSYMHYTAERIEEDDEMDGEPNWIKLFMGAVRPGGKLILVDRLTDLDLGLVANR